jgi:hypothetical protein
MYVISAQRCPTHYSPVENGNVLDIVVHNNARLSEIIVSDILDLDRLPNLFHLQDHVRTRTPSDLVDKFTVGAVSKLGLWNNFT